MKYRRFGIYTYENKIRVIILCDQGSMVGFELEINGFKNFSNLNINKYLLKCYKEITDDNVFIIEIKNNPNFFDNYAYIGEVTSEEVKNYFNEHIEDLILLSDNFN